MTFVRELPEQERRVETGNVRFGDDWCGVFIRGDDAFGYAGSLRRVLQHARYAHVDALELTIVEGLLGLLEQTDERLHHAADPRSVGPDHGEG